MRLPENFAVCPSCTKENVMPSSRPSFPRCLLRLDEHIEKPVILICVAMTLILIPYQVFCRYILGTWLKLNVDTAIAEELSIFAFIWATYFAVPLVIRRRQSIRMTVFVDMLPVRFHNTVLMFNNLAFLALSCLIVFLSVRLLKHQLLFPQLTSALRISYFFPYAILFFGFLLMSVRLVQDTCRLAKEAGAVHLLAAAAVCAIMLSPVFLIPSPNTSLILIGTLFVSMILGVPIGVGLGLAGALAIYGTGFMPLNVVGQMSFNSLDSFPMLAVFYFVLAGIFMGQGGLSSQLIGLADKLIGGKTGGLAMTTVVACIFFGAISGSGIATVAAIGMITIPAMVERGYSRTFSAAIIACAGAIGVMIPPSNPFVLYGVITNTPIGKLFMGGIVPGLITGGLLMAVAWWISRKNGWKGHEEHNTWSDIGKAVWEAKWALMVPVIILGGIYGGIMTPTEAAAVAALYGLLVGAFVLKGITPENIMEVLVNSVVTCSTVLFLVAMASIFGYVMAIEQIPDKIAAWMLGVTSSKYLMLLVVNALLLVAGSLMESVSATIILAPILMPVMIRVGVDPVHFGVIMVCNLAVGFVTPPIGQNLFVAAAIADERPERIALSSAPFLAAMLIMILLVTFLPELSLFLPGLM